VWRSQPPSPLIAEAALLAARAYKEAGNPAEAIRVVRDNYNALPQPQGDALLADAFRAANDLASAARYFQRVYHGYPATPEAERAAAELASLRSMLGDLYPPATPEMALERAQRWADARQYRSARSEFEALANQRSEAVRDIARVRIGVMDYLLYANITALEYLKSLDVSGAADAERWHYILECARRLERDDVVAGALEQLERKHRESPWRLRALISGGNHFLVRNDTARYLPLYRACAETFPDDARSDYCHWKAAWNAYLTRQADAATALRTHLARYPGSPRASGALYFLGRLSEGAGRFSEAKAFYLQAVERFPNHYYGGLAEHRLAEPSIFGAVASQEVRQFLQTIVWPLPPYHGKFEPTPATQQRIERARLLDAAGLEAETERELRFSARTEEQPEIVALRLAQSADKYDPPHRALRLVKGLVPAYLQIPAEDAPAAFWRLLYPLPWRAALERYSRAQGLDPYVVAGLIRQESEFNPNALSPANAYGLTQVMPSTGRQLLKQSRRRFRARVLFNPELNLRLGTTYLRHVLDSHTGRWELALAAYNAGPMRVRNWVTWAEYREAAEFIETIPFTETREYVMAVLRNAEMYRKLYSQTKVETSAPRRPAAKKKAAPTKRRKKR
jgi:soluble lytic murein transglycosylase